MFHDPADISIDDRLEELAALLAAVWAAAQACFIRAGIANEVRKVEQ